MGEDMVESLDMGQMILLPIHKIQSGEYYTVRRSPIMSCPH